MVQRTTHKDLISSIEDADHAEIEEATADLTDAERMALRAEPPPLNANRLGPDGLPGARRQRPLTAQQMAFARGVIEGKSLRQAYRDAYPNDTSADNTISAAANRLIKDTRVSQVVQTAWEETQEHLTEDRAAAQRYVMRQLITLSKAGRQEGSRLKALELLGRAAGMFRESPEQATQSITAESLKRQLSAHLRLLDNARTFRASRATVVEQVARERLNGDAGRERTHPAPTPQDSD